LTRGTGIVPVDRNGLEIKSRILKVETFSEGEKGKATNFTSLPDLPLIELTHSFFQWTFIKG
jgi:hypothetical protein